MCCGIFAFEKGKKQFLFIYTEDDKNISQFLKYRFSIPTKMTLKSSAFACIKLSCYILYVIYLFIFYVCMCIIHIVYINKK